MLDKLETAVLQLQDFPYLGVVLPNKEAYEVTGYRYLAVDKYVVFYRIDDTQKKSRWPACFIRAKTGCTWPYPPKSKGHSLLFFFWKGVLFDQTHTLDYRSHRAPFFLFPYLGGLLAQCAHAAFASPSEPVPAILLSPFVCYRYACTLSGLQYTLLTIAIVCGAGFWLGKRFGGDVDARNFTRSEKGTYGTAGCIRVRTSSLS